MKKDLIKLNVGEVKNVSLKKYSTYKVGGNSIIVYINSVKSLIKLLKYLRLNSIKYKVIGNASNLIFSDLGYSGVLVNLSKINYLKKSKNTFTVSAGYSLIKFASEVSNMGYSNLEFATSIPGSVGGSIYMNAGCYGSDISSVLLKARVLTDDYKVITLYNKDLNFVYRDSIFRHEDYICLDATFELVKGNLLDIKSKITEYRTKRMNSQPLEYPSAGSVFRNPNGMFAGKLIEDLGLKGCNIGGAYVSEKHANFIINKGNATSEDIVSLIEYIKKEVKNNYDVDLNCEQEYVDY